MFNSSLRAFVKKMLPVFLIIAHSAQGAAYSNHLLLSGSSQSQSSSAAAAQTETDALIAQLSKNKHKLSLQQGRLTGDAADFLIREARNSQFFLVAEDHGIAESAEFTAALFRQINPYGYTNFAIEAGPVTARLLEKMAASQESQKAFAEFNRQNPFTVPFYFWKEEARLLETVVKSGDGKGPGLSIRSIQLRNS